MAKIISKDTLNGQVQRIVETPNAFMINGHYYNKSTLSPKPLQIFQTYGDYSSLSMDKNLILRHGLTGGYGWVNKSYTSTIAVDKDDPTISYEWSLAPQNGWGYLYFHKIKENLDGSVNYLGTSSLYQGADSNSYAVCPIAFLGQDSTYLYYIFGSYYYANSNYYRPMYFVKVHKTTFVVTKIRNSVDDYSGSNSGVPYVIADTGDYMYFGWATYYGRMNIYRYSKSASRLDNCLNESTNGNTFFGCNLSQVIMTDATHGYCYGLKNDGTSGAIQVKKISFDFANASPTAAVVVTNATVSWNSTITAIPSMSTTQNFKVYEACTTNFLGNNYITFFIYQLLGDSTTADVSKLGAYTFMVDPATGNLIPQKFLPFSTAPCRGFIMNSTNQLMVAATDNNMLLMSFDGATSGFTITQTLDMQPYYVGFDRTENIWFIDGNSEVQMISPSVPTTVNITFQNPSYQYTGTNISTNLIIEAKNYSGNDVTANLQLTIKGQAVFTSNSSNAIQITTSLTGPIQVPITIQGSGNITVFPKLILS